MKTIKKPLITSVLLWSMAASAQDSTLSLPSPSNPLTLNGYVEAYYSYDFNRPEDNNRPNFLYNFKRHNEFNLNLGFVKLGYTTERTRANLAFAVGTYMNANYAAEPCVLKNIFEANAGYKLSKKSNLWLDIGIMPSHIGFESAIGKDNWTLSRSMVAENTPYFESGAKLSYATQNGKWQFAALALNGWQRITRVEGNSLVSWGIQVAYKPTGKISFNYSNFIGTDKPDSARLWRYYHNLYGTFRLSEKVGLIAGLDYGFEQKEMKSSTFNTWYSPVAILQITPSNKWAFALRGEYYSDEQEVIINTGTPNGFKTIGYSVNIDYLPHTNLALRLEFRQLKSEDDIFTKNGAPLNYNSAVTFSTAIGL